MTKIKKLKDLLDSMGSVLIALSGGVDSAFLLQIASETLKGKVKAVTFISPIFPKNDLMRAENIANRLKIDHIKIKFDILSHSDFCKNDKMRCHVCKTKMIEELKKEAKKQGISYIADGSNIDDMKDYRPGLDVAQKSGIKSPLLEAGLGKKDIRQEAQERKIEIWNTPSSACLASRIAYGTYINGNNLSIIEKGEEFLHQLGFREVRIRYHPPIARIEVSTQEIVRLAELPIRDKVVEKLKELGVKYTTLDLSGFRSGSMNDLLS
ncbi:MAG TPA: ATP-dependent sacrificial sulfur transferase LarE [Desulfatiglandales bacterium]|nr:ATP-dependent sacrificial sulfur transferase LarE [Desulfatiglandales bacterium]